MAQSIDVEHVSLRVELTHADHNDLTLEIVSPTGTVSRVLANGLTPGASSGLMRFDFGVRRFLGEDAKGNRTVRVLDDRDAHQTGAVSRLELTVTGAAGGQDDLYVYTEDFSANWTAARGLYADALGVNTLNFAAMLSPVVLDLTGRTAGVVDGRAFQVAAGAKAAKVYLGAAADRLTGSTGAERCAATAAMTCSAEASAPTGSMAVRAATRRTMPPSRPPSLSPTASSPRPAACATR